MSEMKKVIEEATPQQLLRLAKIARANYVRAVRDTKEVLDPSRLRRLDENIKLIGSVYK